LQLKEENMMPVIRVTEATWDRMKQHAKPLEDTPDDIVRRALDALEGKSTATPKKPSATIGRPTKAAIGHKLPQKEFRNPLLLALDAIGGGGSLDKIREALLPRIEGRLGPADYVKVQTGEARWWNAACWERSDLVKEGYLRSDSPRGRWELSEEGRQMVRRLKA
jgi:hypothetical protein